MADDFKVVPLMDVELEIRLDNNIKGPWVVVETIKHEIEPIAGLMRPHDYIKLYPFNGSLSDCYAYIKLRYYGNI